MSPSRLTSMLVLRIHDRHSSVRSTLGPWVTRTADVSARWPSGTGTARATSSTTHHPVRPGAGTGRRGDRAGHPDVDLGRLGQRHRHRRRARDARHRRPVRQRPPLRRRCAAWRPDDPLTGGRLQPPPHRPRLRHPALRGRGGREGAGRRRSVYAHEDLPDHFRRYERTLGWNTAINQRQFAPARRELHVARRRTATPTSPTRDHLTFTPGRPDVRAAPRPRRDRRRHVDVGARARRSSIPATCSSGPCPNAGNPQKVQRFASDWAAALRRDGRLRRRDDAVRATACRSSAPIASARRSPTPPSCSTRSRPRRWC